MNEINTIATIWAKAPFDSAMPFPWRVETDEATGYNYIVAANNVEVLESYIGIEGTQALASAPIYIDVLFDRIQELELALMAFASQEVAEVWEADQNVSNMAGLKITVGDFRFAKKVLGT